MSSMKLVLVLVLFCSAGHVSDSIMCFQCASTGPEDKCIWDTEGLINSSLGISHGYDKDCNDAYEAWDRCMIESVEYQEKVTVFHRGCHDGKNFPLHFNNSRFINVAPDNATTCAYVTAVKKLVCYTFCMTDFCNGPQPEVKKPCRNVTEYYYDSYYDVDLSEEYEICGALGQRGVSAWLHALAVIVCVFSVTYML
ncbi:unnamed protein product [Lymnaea stagnalis]|uniref:Protein quiver n=1 Tax=Lymnaea stagnalis TaxID=6523 RepID=A0AAV2HE75_LYMST